MHNISKYKVALVVIALLGLISLITLQPTSADVKEIQKKIEELEAAVAQLKSYVHELDANLSSSVAALSNRMGAIELAVSKLQDGVEQAITLTNAFQENLGRVFNRLDADENILGALHGGIGSLAARLDDLEGQTAKLKSDLTRVDSLSGMFSQFQVNLAEIAARQDKAETRWAQLKDMFDQLQVDLQLQIMQLKDNLTPTPPPVLPPQETEQMQKDLDNVKEQLTETREQLSQTQDQLRDVQQKADVAQKGVIISLVVAAAAILAALIR